MLTFTLQCNILNTTESPFDLIFMDIQIPEMDGVKTTRRIRHNLLLTNIPIIRLTG
ncbi:MAG: response regulator [Methylococcales bacterium]|nr:response regulator [Methylococcales bacterium]